MLAFNTQVGEAGTERVTLGLELGTGCGGDCCLLIGNINVVVLVGHLARGIRITTT